METKFTFEEDYSSQSLIPYSTDFLTKYDLKAILFIVESLEQKLGRFQLKFQEGDYLTFGDV